MRELNVNDVEIVSGGDAAVTRAPGTNSWGEITDSKAFYGAACQADGWFSLSCYVVAMGLY